MSKCYDLGMKTHVEEVDSWGGRDTSLIFSKPATSCGKANLENQSPSESLESTWGMLGPRGSSSLQGTRYVLCDMLCACGQHLG